jgi:hydroxymethylglutaryl-CoA reductase
MAYYHFMKGLIDPKITEEFLLAQEEVIDASVWIFQRRLRAHVTSTNGSGLSETVLKQICENCIGHEQTPEAIVLIPYQRRA